MKEFAYMEYFLNVSCQILNRDLENILKMFMTYVYNCFLKNVCHVICFATILFTQTDAVFHFINLILRWLCFKGDIGCPFSTS